LSQHPFIFDLAYDQDATNEKIYLETVRPLIEAAFNKIKVTCFAYGQTGSGKTYTMMGVKNKIPGLYLFNIWLIFISNRTIYKYSICITNFINIPIRYVLIKF